MPDWLEDDRLFDRAIGAVIARDTHFPQSFGASSLGLAKESENATSSIAQAPGIHRYEFVEIIDQGGFGTVWRAHDRDLDRDVAIKVLRVEFEISSSAIERFVSEARITGHLQHAGIPPVYEIGRFPDRRVYLVMKLIRGRTLATILRSQSLDETRRQQYLLYFESLCQTVAFAHANGVIHCDLKPNNVIIGEFGEVNVMDWGLSRSKGHPLQAEVQGVTSSSYPGASPTSVNTPGMRGYMAPEQVHLENGELDERIDVYSLGMMFFELMTGKSFSGYESFEFFDLAVDSEPMRNLVRACLSLDREHRPRTAAELVRVIKEYQSHLRTRLREIEIAHRAAEVRREEKRRRRRMWFAFGLTAALGIVVASGIRMWQLAERDMRNRELVRQVNLYLDEADSELQTGRRLQAEVSLRKAEGLAVAGPEFALETVRDRLKDVRFLEQLESIRFMHSRVEELPYPTGFSSISLAGLVFDRDAPFYYSEAFRGYGIDLSLQTDAEASQIIRSKPIRAALVRAIDEWAMNASRDEERNRLNRIADSAEEPSNGLAHRVRTAYGRGENNLLLTLARELKETDTPETHFAVGHALRKRGLVDEALRVLSDARHHSPRDFWINLELGTVHALIKPVDPAKSKPYIESAFALSDGNANVFTYLGIAQAGADLYADAEASFRSALALNPQLSGGTLRLAYALTAQKKYREALAVVEESILTQPQNPLAYFNRGVILQVQNGDASEIVEAYRRAVTLDPRFAEAWNNLGNALTAMRKYGEADAAFQCAQASKPFYSRAIFNRAVMCDLTGHVDKAIGLYREVIAGEKEYAEAYYNLAHDLAYQKGQFEEAISYLESGIRNVPDSEPSRAKWNRLSESCRQWKRSEQKLDELLKTGADPATPKDATELAVIAAWPHRHQFKTAVQYFVSAFDRNPTMADDLIQGYRYFAAGCAARVIGDRSMRDRAREWLKADLAIREKQLTSNDVKVKQDVKAKLRYWLGDPNLAAVRDSDPLRSFDESEMRLWAEFWDKVRELQK